MKDEPFEKLCRNCKPKFEKEDFKTDVIREGAYMRVLLCLIEEKLQEGTERQKFVTQGVSNQSVAY